MKYPTEKQIKAAAKTSKEAAKALETLYPDLFQKPIKAGEIYSWGTVSDGGSGLVIEHPHSAYSFSFINFHKGFIYISFLGFKTTKNDLKNFLQNMHQSDPKKLHNCFKGEIEGPKYFKSWCTT